MKNKRLAAVLFACFCTVLVAYSIRYSYGTLLPGMLNSLSISKAQAGIIYSSYFIAYTVVSPFLGILADRYDVRFILSGFVILMGLGTFLMQFVNSVLQASLFFALAGIGCGACWAPVMALAQRWVSRRRRGLSLAFIDAGSSLGVIAAGAFVPVAVSISGWRVGWRGLGIMAILMGAANLFLVRDRSGPQSQTGKTRVLGAINYSLVLRDRRFWLVGLAYLLTGFTVIIPFTFLSTHAVHDLVFSYSSAALLITTIGLGGTLGKMVLGPVSDRWGRPIIMALCAGLMTTGCLFIALAQDWWTLLVISFFYGIGYGACWSMYAACASDYFPANAAGGIIGLWTFLMGLGSIAGPIVAGWSGDASGTLKGAFFIAAAGGLGSLLLLLPLMLRQKVKKGLQPLSVEN